MDRPLRKVLLLTYHFPPSGAVAVYRMLGLVRYLPKFGWQPIVVAPPRVPWEVEDASLLVHVPPETPIERVPFASGLLGKIARYCLPESHWLWKASAACNRMILAHRPEAIVTTSPPGCVHLLGRRLQKRYGLPWLADFRDPWATNHRTPNPTLGLRFDRWLEAGVMKQANVLIANTRLNQEGWTAAYPNETHKIVTIPNGFDPERFARPGEPGFVSGRGGSNRLTMLHAGELYSGRDPRPLFDALQQMQTEGVSLQTDFLGRKTEQFFDFESEIQQRGLQDSVRQLGQVAHETAVQSMLQADILLLIHSPGYRVGVPAKLYEYLGAGRPILALAEPDGDVAWVLRESGVLHRIAPPGDVPRIKQALKELTSEIRAGHVAVPDQAALEQFTRERMAERFAECLNRCVVKP